MRHDLLLLIALCLGFAPAPLPRQGKPDLEQLQGEWVRVGCWDGGKYYPYEGAAVETVKGDRVTLTTSSAAYHIRIRRAMGPKAMDVVWRRDTGVELVHQYAYSLKGDSWVCCRLKDPESGRPDSLDGTDPRHYVAIYKRKKP